ncbi:ABC transporter permease [Actinoplanes regularis]|uniref:Peptide/nickel transport system permease protein n=1 Tax=Actinoplanes regularis TaxID=52697 RepID=A0A239JCH8_9ACTN|nr:ABC transporter permease [Actinoplanes regularis]GIE91654.1 peptide ABC transporter permease [Actinoplanes regularis]SNT02364.1 peptide/nickel transport system permease protein [Actinoplanes regularis]
MTIALTRPGTARLNLRVPRPGVAAATLFLAVALTAAIGPSLFAGDPLAADPLHVLEGPSGRHWFGTDQLGRDVFARVVHGARHSLSIGVAATLIAVGSGILIGLIAGLSHRIADEALSRSVDALSAFPLVLLALLFIAIAGPGTTSLIVAIGVALIPHFARVVRAQTFVVRRAAYVTHAVAFGAARSRLVLRHVLPNVLGPVPVLAVIGLSEAILLAAGLSFLGLGPQPPSPEWGAMISEGRGYLHIAWWASVLPGLVVTATIISLTVVGRFCQRRFEGREIA